MPKRGTGTGSVIKFFSKCKKMQIRSLSVPSILLALFGLLLLFLAENLNSPIIGFAGFIVFVFAILVFFITLIVLGGNWYDDIMNNSTIYNPNRSKETSKEK